MSVSIIEKYILYGASFNPPHMGHFSAISQMLEEYDKVIVFPYPMKHKNGVVDNEGMPSLKERFKMLEIFIAEYFPQIPDRLILTDLAAQMGVKENKTQEIVHTYDYLQFVKGRIPKNVHLSVCLGFDTQNLIRTEQFHKEEEIEKDFGVFRLEEESTIKSTDLRKFFSDHKNIKSAKEENYIRSVVGDALASHIFENKLYGLNKSKIKKLNSDTLKSKLKMK